MTRANRLALWFSSRLGQRVLTMQCQALSIVSPRCFGHYSLHVSPVPLSISAFPSVTRCYALIDQYQLPRKTSSSTSQSFQAIMVDMQTLPFESSSINAILLHHTLDIYEHPHQLLREVERVLVPGGRLTLIGFNPWSLWGIASRFLRVVSLLIPSSWVDCCGQYWFWESRYLSKLRLKDWLQLLNFEIDEQLTFSSSVVPEVNKRFCRHFGPLYLLSGVKRANCMTPIKPRWRVPSKRFGAVAISLTTVRQTASTNHSQ